MSGKQTTALIIIFIYMALTIVLGLVVSKRKAAKQAKQSNEDFLMAGKSLGPLLTFKPLDFAILVSWAAERDSYCSLVILSSFLLSVSTYLRFV